MNSLRLVNLLKAKKPFFVLAEASKSIPTPAHGAHEVQAEAVEVSFGASRELRELGMAADADPHVEIVHPPQRQGGGVMNEEIGNFCACMGPLGGDQYCPCRMQREGLNGYYNCNGDLAALEQRGKEASERLRIAMLKLRPEPPESV